MGDNMDAKGMNVWMPSKTSQAITPVERYATDYNMSHKKRGHALIFNHEHFSSFDVSTRTGTNDDRNNLKETLTSLHFEVTVYNDKRWTEIRSILEDISSSNHSENDCILIAILSHGERDAVWAKDCTYKLEKLYSFFAADKCPTLAGKPKLFVVQACQGKKVDPGVTMSSNIQTDSASTSSYRIPAHSDFLIVHSSMPGYVSWRQTNGGGSWFIQSLCEQLRINGKNFDIMKLLTFVNQKVAIDFESNTSEPLLDKMKQMPCTTFMLTRILTFNDK